MAAPRARCAGSTACRRRSCTGFHAALQLLAKRTASRWSAAWWRCNPPRDPEDGHHAPQADVTVHLACMVQSAAEELLRTTRRVSPCARIARQGIGGTVRVVATPTLKAPTAPTTPPA